MNAQFKSAHDFWLDQEADAYYDELCDDEDPDDDPDFED